MFFDLWSPGPALVPILKALADPTRLRILELLKSKGRSCCDLIARDEKGLCACDIEEAVGLKPRSRITWACFAGPGS